MVGCQKVPAAAWRLLATAEWPALKKADFTGRLGKGGPSSQVLFASSFLFSALRASSPLSPPCPGAQVFL